MRSWLRIPLLALATAACVGGTAGDAGLDLPPADATEGDVVNPDWPSCTTSRDCRYAERCAAGTGTCAVPAVPGPWTLAPDFALLDVNENSASYGRDVTLSGLAGHVVVAYFALAT